MSADPLLFRRVMAQFATGVTVVTVRAGDRIHGMTVNSFASVSLVPPLVLWCAENGARTLDLIRESGVFAVNFLAVEQRPLSDRFAARLTEKEDRFRDLEHSPGPATGCPLLPGCLATMECEVEQSVPAGDHTILVARPVAMAVQAEGKRPLLFYSSSYWDPEGAAPLAW